MPRRARLDSPGTLHHVISHLLSDQAMCLHFIKKPARYGHFSVLGCTFQGQKHGCKDFGVL